MAEKKHVFLTCALVGLGVGAAVTAAVVAKKKIDAMSDEEIGDNKILRAIKDFKPCEIIPCCCCDSDGECCDCGCGYAETEAAFVDTTGDGKVDTAFVDTTGDGKLDTAFVDLDGDGDADIKVTEDAVEKLD